MAFMAADRDRGWRSLKRQCPKYRVASTGSNNLCVGLGAGPLL
jgi:hypothetical protein